MLSYTAASNTMCLLVIYVNVTHMGLPPILWLLNSRLRPQRIFYTPITYLVVPDVVNEARLYQYTRNIFE